MMSNSSMRDIKFRAWDKELGWVSDFVSIDNDGGISIGGRSPDFDIDSIDTHTLVIQFYTGLKDKNGVEIYEGDIVVIDGISYCLVKYIQHRCSFELIGFLSGGAQMLRKDDEPILEVIGNVLREWRFTEMRPHESLTYQPLPQPGVAQVCRRCGKTIESDDKSLCKK